MRSDQRGSAAVEFALVLPLLLILLLAIVEFGNLYFDQLAITHAAMAGARAGITGVTPDVAVSQALAAACASLPDGVRSDVAQCGGTAGGSVTAVVDSTSVPRRLIVTIAYPYDPLVGKAFLKLAKADMDAVALSGLASLQY
jgi:Flp pilus assembly protein TadG